MTDPIALVSTRSFSRRIVGCLVVLSLLLLTTATLHAHHLPPGMDDVDEFEDLAAFMAGLRHPLTGLDHWMFAGIAGLVVSLMERRKGLLVLSLLFGATLGGVAGLQGIVLPGSQFGLALAVGVMGATFLLKNRTPFACQASLMSLAAIGQGNQHGLAWPLDVGGGFYLAGVVSMTLLLALCGSAVARMTRSSPSAARDTSLPVPTP